MNEKTQPAVAGPVEPTVMQHTPGPWRDMKEGAIVPLKSVYCERLGFQIGFVNTDRKSVESEARANAELIAAAPARTRCTRSAWQCTKPKPRGTATTSGNTARTATNDRRWKHEPRSLW